MGDSIIDVVTISKHALEPSHLVLQTGLNRIELSAALRSVEMSGFRQITATEIVRKRMDVWFGTPGENKSACSFPNLTRGRQMFEGHSVEKQDSSLHISVSVCWSTRFYSYTVRKAKVLRDFKIIRKWVLRGYEKCNAKLLLRRKAALHMVRKDVADCVPVICLDCCFYVAAALQPSLRVEVFNGSRLGSTFDVAR